MIRLLASIVAASALGGFAFAEEEPAVAPGDWHSVLTNDIARWKADNKAPNGVIVDKSSRKVTFLAEATGLRSVDPAEFAIVGPLSDRAYEAVFVSVAMPEDIARGMDAIGIPRGLPTDTRNMILWPQGECVSLTIGRPGSKAEPIEAYFTDKQAEENKTKSLFAMPAVWTSGVRDAGGSPVCNTNIPCSIMAMYNNSQSLVLLDDSLDQSANYGRFVARGKQLKIGDLFEITMTWSGKKDVVVKDFAIGESDDTVKLLTDFKKEIEGKRAFVRLVCKDDVTVKRATLAAKALKFIDGTVFKMNGAAKNQFFYGAFLPDEKWTNREGRIMQPFEVHIAKDGSRKFEYAVSDWSGEGLDPVLKLKTVDFKEWSELPALMNSCGKDANSVDVLFVFTGADTLVKDLTPVLSNVPERIKTFYIFAE